MECKNGKIIKGIGGFYYVKTEDGIIECRARGKFRKDDIMPYIGDNVSINVDGKGLGYVVDIFERKNCFVRPPVSNIDKLLVVASLTDPAPDSIFIDKMLAMAEVYGVEAAVCFNKADLNDNDDYWKQVYTKAGYKVFVTSAKLNCGLDELKTFMTGSVTAVCGFSGVGKSSILNLVSGTNEFQVGEISTKLSRGKHTTRHVELIQLDDSSYIADTPGFSMVMLSEHISTDNLVTYFREFNQFTKDCRFANCTHTSDKFCGVYDAVQNGTISASRYENYKYLYNVLKDTKERKK